MKFREQLEREHSKVITTAIVREVLKSPKKIDELMKCFIEGSDLLRQRAAWAMSYVFQQSPHLLHNYYDVLIELLNQPNKHDAINRNITRTFQFAKIPKRYQGKVLDISFKLLNSPKEPIAVKAFSMGIIFNLSKEYPDIIPELRASIETLLPNASQGIKSRGNKILKAIQ